MAEFGIVQVPDDQLPRQLFYDLQLTVLRPDGTSGLVQTRTPFVPGEGSRITVHVRVSTRDPLRPEQWREERTTYRVVGRPALVIDEADGTPQAPDVTIECDVKEEEG